MTVMITMMLVEIQLTMMMMVMFTPANFKPSQSPCMNLKYRSCNNIIVGQINLHPFNNVRLLVEVSFLPNILNIPHDYLHKNPTSTYYTLNLI